MEFYGSTHGNLSTISNWTLTSSKAALESEKDALIPRFHKLRSENADVKAYNDTKNTMVWSSGEAAMEKQLALLDSQSTCIHFCIELKSSILSREVRLIRHIFDGFWLLFKQL
jgi:hypothetical protein